MGRTRRTSREKYNVATLKEVRIILLDIASDIDLIPFHQRHLLKKKPKSKKQQLTYSNISENIDTNANLSQQNDHEIFKTKSCSKKELISEKKRKMEKCNKIKRQMSSENIDINKNLPESNIYNEISPTRLNADQQFIGNDIRSNSNKNSLCNQTFNAETSTSNITQQITQPMQTINDNKNILISTASIHCNGNLKVTVPNDIKDRLRVKLIRMEENRSDFKKEAGTDTESSNIEFKDTNPLKHKDSICINDNCKVLMNNELITSTQYYGLIDNIRKNSNLISGINKTEYKIINKESKQYNMNRKRKAISLNVSKIDLRRKIKKTFQNIKTDITPHNQKDARTKLSNKSISLAIDTATETSKRDVDMKHNILIQSPIRTPVDDTITNIIQRGENKHKFSEKSKNNIDNNTDINDAKPKEAIITNSTNYQVQSNIFDNHKNMKRLKDINKDIKNSILNDNNHIQSKQKNNIPENHVKENNCNESMLIKSMSNIKIIDKTCDTNESLISNNKKDIQNRKRIGEREIDKFNSNNKKIKLDRNGWLHDTTSITLKNHQHEHDNDFSNTDKTVTSQSDIVTEHNNDAKKDLREQLIRKRFKNPSKVETISQNNNTNNSLFNGRISNNNNNALITTNTMEDRKICGQTINKEQSFNTTSYKEKEKDRLQISSDNNTYVCPSNDLQDITGNIQCTDKVDLNNHGNINMQEKYINDKTDSIDEDDDCISLFAEEVFDTNQCENTHLDKEEQVCKSKHSDVPYIISNKTIDKYFEQNSNEFNKEYANCTGNDIKELDKSEKEKILNNQQEQVPRSDNAFRIVKRSLNRLEIGLRRFHGYCFNKLKSDICLKTFCSFKHHLQHLIEEILSEYPDILKNIDIVLLLGFKDFSQLMYIRSLTKLSNYQIVLMYRKFCSTPKLKKGIIENIIEEFLNRGMPLREILYHLIANMGPDENMKDLRHILSCVQMHIKNILMQDIEQGGIAVETIASPDSKQETENVSESSIINDVTFENKTINTVKECVIQGISFLNNRSYILHPIDDLPDAQSIYRDRFWKFYIDLNRIKQGLEHQDYDYVIDVLQTYTEKSDKSLHTCSCYNKLRKEIKRSEYHLANIIRLTGDKYFDNPGA